MRRRCTICRITFLLVGLMPLLVAVVYAGWRNSRYDAAYFSDFCGRSFGCLATVGDAQFVRPGVLQLDAVDFADSETGQTVLGCDAIQIDRRDNAVQISIPIVRAATAAADPLLHTIHERVLRQPRFLENEVIVSVDELRFEQANGLAFSKNTIEFRQIDHGTEMRAEFLPRGSEEPIDLTIRRQLTDSGSTNIRLETWQHELPTSLLVGRRNWLPQLTPDATFRGNIWCDLDPRGWSGEVVGGYLRNIDLSSFLGPTYGGWIQGTANFVIRTARFSDGRLESLDVDVNSSAGSVQAQPLISATETWQLSWSKTPALDMPVIDYQELHCAIALDNEGFELHGRAEPTRTILTLTTGERLSTSPDDQVWAPATTIVNVLLPGQSAQRPMTSEAAGLLRVLPLPTVR